MCILMDLEPIGVDLDEMLPENNPGLNAYRELPHHVREKLGFEKWKESERQNTHMMDDDCYDWGPRHYECAVRKAKFWMRMSGFLADQIVNKEFCAERLHNRLDVFEWAKRKLERKTS